MYISIHHVYMHIHTHTHTYILRLLFRLRATLAKNTEYNRLSIARSSYIAYSLRRDASNLSLIYYREHGEPEIRGHRQFRLRLLEILKNILHPRRSIPAVVEDLNLVS